MNGLSKPSPHQQVEKLTARLRDIEEQVASLRSALDEVQRELAEEPTAEELPMAEAPVVPPVPPPVAEKIEPVPQPEIPAPPGAAPPPPVADPGPPTRPEAIPPPDSEPGRTTLETQIGTVWFTRLGLIAIVIGFALLAKLVHPYLQPWHKVAVSYLASFGLFFLGRRLPRKVATFAKPVMAGGVALSFFTSFAAHFVAPMQCVSLWTSLFLMALAAGWLFMCAERWGSEPTAGLALLLGHIAAYVAGGEADSFSLSAILMLSGVALLLFVRHRWSPLTLFALAAAYLSHLLWYVQDYSPADPGQRFWVNFIFLTAYYLLFTAADLLFHRDRHGADEPKNGARQQVSGRSVGPASIVLYATMAAALFHDTALYWDRIHWFLFPLALLQVALLATHRSYRNPDFALYGVCASLFAMLALFSLFDGLTLNLALAAEAVLLLVLSRKLDLWFLNPLAQLVLAINFIHFWTSNASRPARWPEWLGGVITASVYAVKARLEETWKGFSPDEDTAQPSWLIRLKAAYEPCLFPLALLHAPLAALIAAWQTHAFFDPGMSSLIVALLSVLAGLLALVMASRALLLTVWGLQFGVVLLLLDGRLGDASAATQVGNWNIRQLAALLAVAGGSWFTYLTRIRTPAASRLMALGSFVPGTLALLVAPSSAGEIASWPWLALAGPIVLWFTAHLLIRPVYQDTPAGRAIWFDRLTVDALSYPGLWQYGLAAAAALTTWYAANTVWPHSGYGLWVLAASMALLIACIMRVPGKALPVGLFVLQALTVAGAHRFTELPATPATRTLAWALGALMAAAALRSAVALRSRNRTPNLLLPFLHIVLLSLLGSIFWLHCPGLFASSAAWVLLFGIGWIAMEVIDTEAHDPQSDTDPLRRQMFFLLPIASAWMALVIAMITAVTADTAMGGVRIHLALGALFGLLALLRRSAPLAAALSILLVCTHVIVLAHIGLTHAVRMNPLFVFLLWLVTIAVGAGCERLSQHWRSRLSPNRHALMVYGFALAYFLGLVTAWRLGGVRLEMLTGIRSAALVGIVLPAVVLAYAGCRFRLPGLLHGIIAYLGALLAWIILASFSDAPRFAARLALAGGLTAILYLVIERIVLRTYLKGLIPRLRQRLFLWHRLLVVAAAAILVTVFYFDAELRGSWTTLGWSVTATGMMLMGFTLKDGSYRRTSLGLFFLCIARIVLVDTAQLELFYRTVAYITLGVCLLVASYFYTRFKDDIAKWLE